MAEDVAVILDYAPFLKWNQSVANCFKNIPKRQYLCANSKVLKL